MSKILLLTHDYPVSSGYVGRCCWNLAAAAAAAGNDVTWLVPDRRGRETVTRPDPAGVRVIRFPGDRFQFRSLWRLERVVNEAVAGQRWDIIHAADWPMILALRRVERTHGIRIASLHAPDVLLLGRSFRALLCGAGEALARFDRYVCSSVHAESMLRREFRHVGSADVRTVPTGVDRWWFAEPAEPELQEFQRSINYWAGDRIVLTVGDLAAREGHLCTLEALGSLPEADRLMVKYVCIGKTVDPDYLKRLVRTAEAVGVRTVLPGNLPHELIRAAYRLAEVLAVSGQGLPMNLQAMGTLLEAAAQGLPALVNRVEPVPEVVRDRNTGWVCKGASSEEIGRTFAEALAGTERTAMRAACVAHASRFSWERCANATYNLGRPWRLDETYIEKYVGVS